MYTFKYMCVYIDINIHRGPGLKKRRWTSAIYRKCGGPMACKQVSGLIWGGALGLIWIPKVDRIVAQNLLKWPKRQSFYILLGLRI